MPRYHIAHTCTRFRFIEQYATALAGRTNNPSLLRLSVARYGIGNNGNYVSGLARGNEWRTTPLWGIGLQEKVNGHTYFLHDGRARNLVEAIMWHGGEGEASKNLFKKMSKEDRDAVIAFLNSL